ncbi:MAG TPA: hypothetical protein VE870_06770 [Bacteroidales bacterium]|nr:hypothetical protein [Bacteroidales bacterium]
MTILKNGRNRIITYSAFYFRLVHVNRKIIPIVLIQSSTTGTEPHKPFGILVNGKNSALRKTIIHRYINEVPLILSMGIYPNQKGQK